MDSNNIYENKIVLITGGTGSFGKKCTHILLNEFNVKKIIIFSRDEFKQYKMEQKLKDERLRFFLGDVRDLRRLKTAFKNVDIVIHAAALKQVPAAEYNPFEFVKTNILGAQNIIEAAVDKGVERVLALSTDKAAAPINLYGATKLTSDKLFIAGNVYSKPEQTIFSVVRYGNVVGSRGSVIPFFMSLKKQGVKELPVTDLKMTRFWITKDQAVRFSLKCLYEMQGGEMFVPKIPSMKIKDLAEAVIPGCKIKEIGIRPGEKLHEIMITRELARNTYEFDDFYLVVPEFHKWKRDYTVKNGGKKVNADFEYNSNNNSVWLTKNELKKIINELELDN